MFYSFNMVNDKLSIQWHNSTLCNEFYNEIDIHMSVDAEYGQPWACPDISNLTLDNNPTMYTKGNGTSFIMVANACSKA